MSGSFGVGTPGKQAVMSICHFTVHEPYMRSCERFEHVLVRAWTGEGLPVLTRAECFSSSGASEAAVQQSVYGLDFRRTLYAYPTNDAVARLLATEVASRPHDDAIWRDYADWAWRHDDPRGALVELYEAHEQAREPGHRRRIEAELHELERAHFLGWRRELEASHRCSAELGTLHFRRGHLVGVSGLPKFELDPRAPTAISELEFPLRSANEIATLRQTLARPHWAGLARCCIRLDTVLDDAATGELIDALWANLPRLRELSVRGGPGALSLGARGLAALHRLLTRHLDFVCGVALERLSIDIDDPPQGWSFDHLAHLIGTLTPANLREFVLRAPTIPDELRNWTVYSGFADRLTRCELLRRAPARASACIGARPRVARAEFDARSDAMLVWTDWLQARGEALGEFAVQWLAARDGHGDGRREQLRCAQARVELELGVTPDGGIEVDWRGPVIQRLRVNGGQTGITELRHALAAEACAWLHTLAIDEVEPALVQALLRWAGNHDVLRQLTALELAGERRVDLGRLLDALPALERLSCRVAEPCFGAHRPHALHELHLHVPADLDRRSRTRLFAALGHQHLPKLRSLTLELAPRSRGPALPFDRLELAPGVHLSLAGSLRQVDVDALLHWARDAELGLIDIRYPQAPHVERQLAARLRRHPSLVPCERGVDVPRLHAANPWSTY